MEISNSICNSNRHNNSNSNSNRYGNSNSTRKVKIKVILRETEIEIVKVKNKFLIKSYNCFNKNMNVKTLNVKIDEFVSYTMSFLNNIQVFHWQTQSYAEHEALGEYYESLTDLNDKLVESWQGNQNTRLKFSEGPYSLENYFSKEETKNKINEFKNQVTQLSGFVAELNESNSFDDIENILEEISEVNSRTLYLLSLS